MSCVSFLPSCLSPKRAYRPPRRVSVLSSPGTNSMGQTALDSWFREARPLPFPSSCSEGRGGRPSSPSITAKSQLYRTGSSRTTHSSRLTHSTGLLSGERGGGNLLTTGKTGQITVGVREETGYPTTWGRKYCRTPEAESRERTGKSFRKRETVEHLK